MIRKMFRMLTAIVSSIHNHKHSNIWPFCKSSWVLNKKSAMKSKNIQQEILVFTHTSFVQKAIIENTGNNNKGCFVEKLEKALWNGMLKEMLPELMLSKQGRESELSIWQISTGEFSLLIEMAEAPDIVQDARSISPILFLSTPKMN